MKISTKGRYSVRFMIDLVLNGGNGPVLLRDVSRRQGISEKYLGHLVPLLKNAGLIHAMRGAKGGFTLALLPRDITLKDIVAAVEGPICLVGCTQDPGCCQRSANCTARDFWDEATRSISEILASFTLESMAERQRVKTEALNYAI
jgi:Rrf2 family protein